MIDEQVQADQGKKHKADDNLGPDNSEGETFDQSCRESFLLGFFFPRYKNLIPIVLNLFYGDLFFLVSLHFIMKENTEYLELFIIVDDTKFQQGQENFIFFQKKIKFS